VLFNQLELIEPILKALSDEGYTHPTPIQQKAIPAILSGNDLLACAQTGTGKTAAFAIPLLQLIHENGHISKPQKKTVALILTPTRELALQIQESFVNYGRHLSIKSAAIFGGVSQAGQVRALQQGADVVIATPGRLLDLYTQQLISFRDLKYFVLDEADRMLDSGFIHDIKKIAPKLPAVKQTLLFSATMPDTIKNLSRNILNNPVSISVTPVSSTAEKIDQSVYHVGKSEKPQLLVNILKDPAIKNILVFTQMKHSADKLCKYLNRSGISSAAIHGNKSQNHRLHSLKSFKNRSIRVLVATDIAARGIDIDNLTHVLNFDLPNVPETYVHRIGRTGRAGMRGTAMSFCDLNEKPFLRDIEKLIKKTIPRTETPLL
jgi:ATP-dependent RNA helicase RhlE